MTGPALGLSHSGAGSLGVQLGGAAIYHGQLEERPVLGAGVPATGPDIGRAWRLVTQTTALWLVAGLALALLLELLEVLHA